MAKAKSAVPAGFHTVTPQLTLDNASSGRSSGTRRLSARKKSQRATGPDGKIMHAEIRVGDSLIMLNDVMGPNGKGPRATPGSPASLWVYVQDSDAVFSRAVSAGARVLDGPMGKMSDQFWAIAREPSKTPRGYTWTIATRKDDLTPQEMKQRQDEVHEAVSAQPTHS
jgi:uncharacterized glyoxalase superfamily protein PhnB